MFNRHHFLAYAGLAALVMLAHPQSPFGAETPQACSFSGLIAVTDGQGVAVREGPGRDFAMIAVLPQVLVRDGTEFAPEFEVKRFTPGWFEIGDAGIGQYFDGERTLFTGPGWLPAEAVTVWIEGDRLFSEPDTTSKPSFLLEAPNAVPEEAYVTQFHGCSGSFIDVTVERPDGVSGRGWIEDICSNQVTTCV